MALEMGIELKIESVSDRQGGIEASKRRRNTSPGQRDTERSKSRSKRPKKESRHSPNRDSRHSSSKHSRSKSSSKHSTKHSSEHSSERSSKHSGKHSSKRSSKRSDRHTNRHSSSSSSSSKKSEPKSKQRSRSHSRPSHNRRDDDGEKTVISTGAKRRRKRKSGWDEVVDPAKVGTQVVQEAILQQQQQQLLLQQQALLQERLLLQQQNSLQARMQNRIYVGSLNYELTEEHVKIPFELFGTIVTIDMPKENTGRSKGFCFLEYGNPESAQRALDTMNGFILGGRSIKVGRPTAMNTGPLTPFNPPSGSLSSPVATRPLTFNTTPTPQLQKQLFQISNPLLAAANLTQPTYEQASTLRKQVQHAMELTKGGKKAEPPTSNINARIYVGSIPWDLKSHDVKQVFEAFGEVLTCQLIPNQETGKHRGYGFVEFKDMASAKEAMTHMNGFELCGRNLKVGPAHNQPTAGISGDLSGVQTSLSQEENMKVSRDQRYGVMKKLQESQERIKAQISRKVESKVVEKSRCILLKNMVMPTDVDTLEKCTELEEETREECSKFGVIQNMSIRLNDGVELYLLFEKADDAMEARESLDNRWFGGRVVEARFYDVDKLESMAFKVH